MKRNKNLDEKFLTLKIDVANEIKMREESEEYLITDFETDIINLNESVSNESKIRDDRFEDLIRIIGDNLSRGYQALDAERNSRKAIHELYKKFVNELKAKIENQIAQDRRERELFEENLIRVLENACRSMETGVKL
mmetsp:Transcript_9618/g.9574  ORF Transcript_9618/g.9574 Transcript_9618/m.9574 type:complete len:137 (+) Transcript_9618:404-814(+)